MANQVSLFLQNVALDLFLINLFSRRNQMALKECALPEFLILPNSQFLSKGMVLKVKRPSFPGFSGVCGQAA